MSPELRDLRAKITVETDAVLDAIAKAEGRDRSEIVREVLHAWAVSQIDAIPEKARLLQQRLKAEGLLREFTGSGAATTHVGNDRLELEATGRFPKGKL